MNFVGKILVVLIFVMSLVFMSFAAKFGQSSSYTFRYPSAPN